LVGLAALRVFRASKKRQIRNAKSVHRKKTSNTQATP